MAESAVTNGFSIIRQMNFMTQQARLSEDVLKYPNM